MVAVIPAKKVEKYNSREIYATVMLYNPIKVGIEVWWRIGPLFSLNPWYT